MSALTPPCTRSGGPSYAAPSRKAAKAVPSLVFSTFSGGLESDFPPEEYAAPFQLARAEGLAKALFLAGRRAERG